MMSLGQHAEQKFESDMQDPRVLKPTDKNAVSTSEFRSEINYDDLDAMEIPNNGRNEHEDAKLEEADKWAEAQEDDIITTITRIDAAGNEIQEHVDLKKYIEQTNNEVEGMNKLMECGRG